MSLLSSHVIVTSASVGLALRDAQRLDNRSHPLDDDIHVDNLQQVHEDIHDVQKRCDDLVNVVHSHADAIAGVDDRPKFNIVALAVDINKSMKSMSSKVPSDLIRPAMMQPQTGPRLNTDRTPEPDDSSTELWQKPHLVERSTMVQGINKLPTVCQSVTLIPLTICLICCRLLCGQMILFVTFDMTR